MKIQDKKLKKKSVPFILFDFYNSKYPFLIRFGELVKSEQEIKLKVYPDDEFIGDKLAVFDLPFIKISYPFTYPFVAKYFLDKKLLHQKKLINFDADPKAILKYNQYLKTHISLYWSQLQEYPIVYIKEYSDDQRVDIPVTLTRENITSRITLSLDIKNNFLLTLDFFESDDQLLDWKAYGVQFLYYKNKYKDKLALLVSNLEQLQIIKFKGLRTISISKERFNSDFYTQYNTILPETFQIHEGVHLQLIKEIPCIKFQIDEMLCIYVRITPIFIYQNNVCNYNDKREYFTNDSFELIKVVRDFEMERNIMLELKTFDTYFRAQDDFYFHKNVEGAERERYVSELITFFKERNYSYELLLDITVKEYISEIPLLASKITDKIDWFDLHIDVIWGKISIPFKQVRDAILNDQKEIEIGDNIYGKIPQEWIEKYDYLLTKELKKDVFRFNKKHFNEFDTLQGFEDFISSNIKQEIELKKQKLLHFDKIENTPVSEAIQASLRFYQKEGFRWMQSLEQIGWGGCLADDMGLGKTLQTITFLQYLKEKYSNSISLIVCPTALIYNWVDEIEKFCPTLRYHVYYGLNRVLEPEDVQGNDVIITSYGVVRNDFKSLVNHTFRYIILDESHVIRNQKTQTTKAINALKSVNKLILSGTPIQNNIVDLYTQFEFINKGFFGSQKEFSADYGSKITKETDLIRLKKRVTPFILRRTKKEVAKDLPEKSETILWCEMTLEQKKIYESYRQEYRETILNNMDNETFNRSKLQILQGITCLRQICVHPNLISSETQRYKKTAKITALFEEIIPNIGSSKILIFSQFTTMLQLVKEELDDRKMKYSYLDGKTPAKERKNIVDDFQNNDTSQLFLLSLKAGGVGLNLTVAEYVVILDPWWNPSAEAQAIDRCYRIGQTKAVFAYKFICKDTIEEKILRLQQHKIETSDSILGDDDAMMKKFTLDDIKALFE